MTPELAIQELKKLGTDPDTEVAHATADKVLCELLIALGHKDVVEAWDKISKWYA